MRPPAWGRRAQSAVEGNEVDLGGLSKRAPTGRGNRVSKVERRMSEGYPIYADFVSGEQTGTTGGLGMTLAPGMKADTTHGEWRWERDLKTDLRVLREECEADTLVSVMEKHEYSDFEIPDLFERDLIEGIEVLRFAIEDMNVPEEARAEEYERLIRDIVDRMGNGKNVIVHCCGGLGRTGTVAACVLVALGNHSADEAIGAVRAARKGTVQTGEQEDFVRRFEETLREREGENP